MPTLSFIALVVPLAFSPYAVGSLHASHSAQPAEQAPEDAAAANGWDDPVDEAAAENGWDTEQPAPEGNTEAAPTDPAAQPGPVPPPTVPPPDATGIVKKPAPVPADKKGIGLMAAAGAVGGIALGSGIGRMVIISKACASTSDVVMDAEQSISKCVTEAKNLLTLTVVEWLANATSYGLAPAAGMVRGRYDASRYMYYGKPDTNGVLIAGIGGGLLGVGVIAKIALWASVLSGKRFVCPVDADYGKCVRKNFVGYFGGSQLASTSIAFGAGMLGYGVFYDRDRKAKERLFFRPEQVTFSPTFDRNFAGFSLSGRF